eukprot:TRINITY_DN11107_c1_g1_i4.p1 TRINITY_DN11107_c1_g1~~TRINITY_DN11107_c1_g1_i4.p1  ORF type:complete len:938 (+),score=91.47 TRINITY_DN11107_c1_g1_i4:65-2878(+)
MRILFLLLLVGYALGEWMCDSGGDCKLSCTNDNPCKNARCPQHGTCLIECDGDKSCNFLGVSGSIGDMVVTCSGDGACKGADIHCPEHRVCDISCASEGGSSCSNSNIYGSITTSSCVNTGCFTEQSSVSDTGVVQNFSGAVSVPTNDGFALVYIDSDILHIIFVRLITGVYLLDDDLKGSVRAPGCTIFDACLLPNGDIVIVYFTKESGLNRVSFRSSTNSFSSVASDSQVTASFISVLRQLGGGSDSYLMFFVPNDGSELHVEGYKVITSEQVISRRVVGTMPNKITQLGVTTISNNGYGVILQSESGIAGFRLATSLFLAGEQQSLTSSGTLVDAYSTSYGHSYQSICGAFESENEIEIQCFNESSSTNPITIVNSTDISNTTIHKLVDNSLMVFYFERGYLRVQYINRLFHSVITKTILFAYSFYASSLINAGTQVLILSRSRTDPRQVAYSRQLNAQIEVNGVPKWRNDSDVPVPGPEPTPTPSQTAAPQNDSSSEEGSDAPPTPVGPGSLPLLNEVVFVLLAIANVITSSVSASPIVQIITVVANTWDCVTDGTITFDSNHIYRGVVLTSILGSNTAGYVVFNTVICFLISLLLLISNRFLSDKVPELRYPSSVLITPILLYFGTFRGGFELVATESGALVAIGLMGMLASLAAAAAVVFCNERCAADSEYVDVEDASKYRKYIFGAKEWRSTGDTLLKYGVIFDSYSKQNGVFRNGRFFVFELFILTSLCCISNLNIHSYNGCLAQAVVSAVLIGFLCVAHVMTYPLTSPFLNELTLVVMVLGLLAIGCFGYGFAFKNVDGPVHQVGYACLYMSLSLCIVRILIHFLYSIGTRIRLGEVKKTQSKLSYEAPIIESIISDKKPIPIFKDPTISSASDVANGNPSAVNSSETELAPIPAMNDTKPQLDNAYCGSEVAYYNYMDIASLQDFAE